MLRDQIFLKYKTILNAGFLGQTEENQYKKISKLTKHHSLTSGKNKVTFKVFLIRFYS
jgi:hypothetical protein